MARRVYSTPVLLPRYAVGITISRCPVFSEEVIGASDDEVKRILGEIVAETTYTMKMIGEDKLRQIAQVVCDKNTMTGYDFKDELAKIIGDFARYRMPNAV
jgi:hypothetical protein